MSCACPQPLESPNPRHAGTCNICGKIIDPTWSSNDQTFAEFMDRLEDAFPGSPPPEFERFRLQCQRREREGRSKFGYSYLARENLGEGKEEFSDGNNYFFFDLLKARRAGEDELWELELKGAYHAYLAHRTAQEIKAKRRGSP